MAKQQTAVMGVDPSIAATGVWVEAVGYQASGTLPAKSRRLKGDQRLSGLREELEAHITQALIAGHPIDLCVIEDLPRNAMGAGLTGMAAGIVRDVLSAREMWYIALAPATVKKAMTGSGKADKGQMIAAIPEDVRHLVADDNQADGFALAQCALEFLGRPNALADPSALDKYR